MFIKKTKVAAAVITVLSALNTAPLLAEEAKENVEVITVTGLKNSLVAVAALKKDSNFIKDSIVSEDIGKFPDSNVAESLQRISGVSIDRNGGEGQKVTVRGFGPEFNTVLLNGRRMASDSPGRAFHFDLLSSELIGAADVFKTSSVALQEGGIGSTINLKTQKPLDIGKFKAVASAKGMYEDKSSELSPNIFGFISNTFADDTVGLLLSVSHQERVSTQDSILTGTTPESGRWDTQNYTGSDLWKFRDNQGNGAGKYTYQRQYNYARSLEDRSRTGATGVFQYTPNDNMVLTIDALYSKLDVESTINDRFSHRSPPAIHNLVADENNVITSYDMIESPMYVQFSNNRPSTAKQFGAKLEWELSDNLSAVFDVSKSTAEMKAGGKDYYVVSRASDHILRVDNTQGGDAPIMQVFKFTPNSTDTNQDGNIDSFDYTLGSEVLAADPNDQRSWFGKRKGENFKDDITELKADFTWVVDSEFLTEVTFGAITSTQEKSKYDTTSPNAGFYLNGRVDLPANIFTPVNRSGFLSGAKGDFRSDALYFNQEAWFEYLERPETLAQRDTENGLAPGTSASDFLPGGYNVVQDSPRSYNIEEDIVSAYVNGTFEMEVADMPLVINAGVRYTETKLDSLGYAQAFVEVKPSPSVTDSLVVQRSSEVTPLIASSDYSEFLPSINARLDITDNFVARLAYSKTLTRPEMTMLNPAAVTAQEIRYTGLEATAGNPDLEPFVADNFDLSLEWYYSETGFLTAGFFRKDINGFIVSGVEREGLTIPKLDALIGYPDPDNKIDVANNTLFLDVTRPRNLEETSVDGVEIAFQQVFDMLPAPFNAIGVSANLTYVDSDHDFDVSKTDNNLALPGLGDSKNIVLFYDDETIEARIAYNKRSKFFSRFQGIEPWFTEEYDQIDVRVAYNFNETTQIFIEGTNLTDSVVKQHGRYESQFLQLDDTGRRYAFGVRTSF
ncbi:TonB-dependent receptor [Pseudocolwellia agarivorans]|uniref:TonB-dependent receptor n=1 Tax=Pseudocolwellia agarivorans TaxID=1911682 RepID=UPI0009867869|nr:TonB-dependent receptor [Pseudocolwellia agarivorans]